MTAAAEKPGAKRLVVTELGNGAYSTKVETWDVMPGIAPEPWFAWDEVQDTYRVCHSLEDALIQGKTLMEQA